MKHNNILSKKIIKYFIDDISIFGSISFYWVFSAAFFFLGLYELFNRLAYCFLISIIVVIAIKSVHYKDRPQKEEFTIFMEKMIASSFPSTHSINITLISILLIYTFSYNWLMVMMPIIAFLVYLQRYISKKHFIIDIIGGILIGVAEAVFVLKVL